MKNSRRFFAAGLVVFVLLFSGVSQSLAAKSRKRCPVRIPDSLLTLYLKSDLIVRGTISGEKFLKKTNEYDYGYTYDLQKNLRVSKTLKGMHTNSAAFVVSQYKPTKPEENSEPEEEENLYTMNAGEEALFFLIKNEEENSYELADDSSGMKNLDAADLDVYAKRIGELNGITKTKKNQLAKLTEWLVQLIEHPLTRHEGTLDLGQSFAALDNEAENEEEEEDSQEKQTEVREPFVLDKNFSSYNAPEIAGLLTDSQKQRISNVFLNLISEDLQKINRGTSDDDDDGEIYPDYGLMNIVVHWDKTNPPMSAYALLANSADANPQRISYLMQIISRFLENEGLNEIAGEYESAASEPDNEEVEYEEVKPEKVESAAIENEAVSETETATVEQIQANQDNEESQKIEEPKEKTAAKISYKKYKAILFEKFTKQYGIAIAQSSAAN